MLIIVIGITMSFSVFQLRMNYTVSESSDNFTAHYMETLLQHTANNGINYAINRMWETDSLGGTYQVISNMCTTDVEILTIGLDSLRVKAVATTKVLDPAYYAVNGTMKTIKDSIMAFFSYQIPASNYFWYSNSEGNVYWVTGDTITGPIHTNGLLRTYGSPVFQGKVTATSGITPDPTSPSSEAIYNDGWEIGVSNSVVVDVADLKTRALLASGALPVNYGAFYNEELFLEFMGNGEVIREVDGEYIDTVAIATIAPSGILYSEKNVSVKGVLKGELTIYTEQSIQVTGQLIYNTDPRVYPESTDMLGLVANNDVVVADNGDTNSDLDIHASMMAVNGSFTAQNYETRSIAGDLNILGSIVQDERGAVGTFNWSSVTLLSGFSKNYEFDNRLSSISPPNYPYVKGLRLISWWE